MVVYRILQSSEGRYTCQGFLLATGVKALGRVPGEGREGWWRSLGVSGTQDEALLLTLGCVK